jgi:hypothetical protein
MGLVEAGEICFGWVERPPDHEVLLRLVSVTGTAPVALTGVAGEHAGQIVVAASSQYTIDIVG